MHNSIRARRRAYASQGRHVRRRPLRMVPRRGLGIGTIIALVAALVPAVAFGQLVVDAAPASAATITTGGVQAQMAGHVGWTGQNGSAAPNANNCIRFGSAAGSPTSGTVQNPGGTSSSTAWVSAGSTAYSAHGRSGSSCPTSLSLTQQSALGFSPANVTTIEPGTVFNLGRMLHSNNPIQATSNWFRGDMNIRFMGQDMTYNWRLHETPNSGTSTNPSNNDVLTFLNQISDKTFTVDGLTYTLVVEGFTAPQNGDTCDATRPDAGGIVNQFSTVETKVTYGCLYGSVQQVRELTIEKVVAAPDGAPATIPAFGFTSTSTLAGSPWDGAAMTLKPTALGDAGAASRTQPYVVGQTVTVTESTPPAHWLLTGIACTDGVGAAIPATVNLVQRTVTLTGDLSTGSAAANEITCRYTNTYAPSTTLTLAKDVVATGQPAPVASSYNWTLAATRTAPAATGAASIEGRGQQGQTNPAANPQITGKALTAGTYALSESADGQRTGGFDQGAWVCTTATGAPVAVQTVGARSLVTLAAGDDVTCVVTNTYRTGSLAITKTVTSTPAGGYTQGQAMSFRALYSCTADGAAQPVTGEVTVRPSATNGQPGSSVVIPNLPAGADCTVTEVAAPTGSTGLVDSSWTWGAPQQPGTVTIVADDTVTANLTNPVTQQRGGLQIAKVVTPVAGTPAAGYTGGGDRVFAIDYVCEIDGATVAAGTAMVSPNGAVNLDVPATADCRIVGETLDRHDGDFADASYQWEGWSASAPVTVPAAGAATLTVTNEFVRELATLNLAKVVVGDGYVGTADDFTVSYVCADVAGSVSLADGGSAAVSVPVGVRCTVTEQTPSEDLLRDGWVWATPTYDGLTDGEVVVPAGGSATVTVTNSNEIGHGRITVTKAIANHAAAVAPGTTFDLHVVCEAPAEGESDPYSRTFTMTWPGTTSATTAFLPVGTECVVTETSALDNGALTDGSYAWAPVPAPVTVVVPATITPVTATVTNDIVRVSGLFGIEKVVDNRTGAGITAPFTGGWVCALPSGGTRSGTWSAPAGGGAATLQPGGGTTVEVLVGSSCTVTEDAPANPVPGDMSYVWAQELPGAVTVPAAGATATVTNTLTRSTGSFTVAKSVEGGAVGEAFPADAVFPFTWQCTPASGDPLSGSLAVTAGASAAPTEDIPGGSDCWIEEGALPDDIDPYTWDGVTLTVTGAAEVGAQYGARIAFTTHDDGTAVQVAAVNRISPKTVAVSATKTVIDPDGGFTGGSDRIFPLTLVCDDASMGEQLVARDGTATWTDVPLGAECFVREGAVTGGLADASFQWGAVAISPSTLSVDDMNGSYSFTVTNRVDRAYGQVGLVKIVDGGGFSGVLDPYRVYTGTWTCTYGDVAVGGGWTTTGSAAGAVATLTGPHDRVLLTSDCVAAEDDLDAPSTDPSYSWATPVITGTTVTADAGANVMQVINTLTRDTGSVTVAKTVSGETTGFAPAGDFAGFAVGIVCALPGAEGTYQNTVHVAAGADPMTLISGVPNGWECRVDEAPVSGQLRDASFAWGSPTVTVDGAQSPVFTIDGTHAVAIDNPITRVTGTLTVDKLLTPAAAEVGAGVTFTGAYVCSYKDGEALYTGTWTVDGAGRAALAGDTDIPLTSDCSITEDALDDADLPDASWTWAAPTLSADAVVASAAVPAQLTVTNDIVRVWAGLSVEKTYTGPSTAFDPYLQAGGAWTCVYDGQVAASGRWQLPAAGGSVVLVEPGDRRIPATAECTVREDTLLAEDLTDASYRWLPVTYTPEGGVVTAAANETAQVGVHNATERAYGQFGVTKQVVAGAGVPENRVDATLQYSGAWQCVYPGDAPVTGTWGPVLAGATWTSDDILVGSDCVVTSEERADRPVPTDASFQWLPADLGAAVTVDTAQQNAITVTNEAVRLVGSFGVSKTVAGDIDGLVEASVFSFQWQCVAEGGDLFPAMPGEFTLADGEVWNAPANIPVGADCVVTETSLADPAHPSYAWSTTMTAGDADPVEGTTVQLEIVDDASLLVAAVNTLTRTPGTYAVAKTSDPGTGATVVPGDRIDYTVTVTPGDEGFVDDVVVTDDMRGVLPYASLVADSVVAAQGTATVGDGEIVWQLGRVLPGEPVTLTYSVVVAEHAVGVEIGNTVTVTGEFPPDECDPCTTTHLTPAWTLSKSADPASGSTVLPGQRITYTLTATNTSQAVVAGASAIDDLGEVLHGAALTGVLDAALAQDGDVLTWTVPVLAPGETATVSYTVQVADDARGATLRNVVTPSGPGGECEGECETTHGVPAWELSKTSNPPSGYIVGIGAPVEYTLTVRNTGPVAVSGALAVDDMSGVLPYATLRQPLADGLTLGGETLTWAVPHLEPGETASISYTVTMTQRAAGQTVRNTVAPGGTPGGECDPCTVETPVVPGLPVTGGIPPWGAAAGGIGVILAGLALWLIGRRRQDQAALAVSTGGVAGVAAEEVAE